MTGLDVELHPVHLSRREVEDYYHNFSNRTLWPLLHGLVEQPELWQSAAAWHEHVAGPPRIAEDVYSWTRPETETDRSLLPLGLRNGNSFDQ